MTSVDFARVRRLVELVHDLGPESRDEVLARECRGDHALRAEVEDVLRAALASPEFLAPPPNSLRVDQLAAPAPEASVHAGTAIEGFRLVRRVATGGMGAVWEAEQASPRRKVALKTLRFVELSREGARRFRLESEILARLRHPNIAQVFASGVQTLPSGEALPWFALEFVEDALSLTEFARERSLDRRTRLQLFATLCDAVQHGHERGVIHRDLKPSNVLVDRRGMLKVIDFGVARDRSGAFASFETETGRIIGTLQYMSPEQIAGSSDGLDTRSDVYALGVMLYELVTDALPYEIAHASLADAARILTDETPARPSSRAAHVDADLDAIVLKALEKDRARRYVSAAALATDLARYLVGEPVEARAPSVGYQVRAFTRRHRVLVGVSAAVVATLVLAAPVGFWLAWRATDAEKTALGAKGEALSQRDEARFREYSAEIAAAYAALRGLNASSARQHLARCPEETRGFEWWMLNARLDRSSWTRTLDGRAAGAVLWQPDGKRLFAAPDQDALEAREPRSGRLLARVAEPTTALNALAIDPAGTRLLLTLRDGRLRLLDTTSLAEIASWKAHEPSAAAAVFDASGEHVLSGGTRSEVVEWNARTGERMRDLENANIAISCLDASRDGRWLVGGTNVTAEVLLWDLASGALVRRMRGHTGYVACVAFDPTSTLIASASHDHTLRLWDVATGETRHVLRGHDNLVMRAAFDPAGERLASCGWDRTVRLWRVADGAELERLVGCEANITALAFSPDGALLATGDAAAKVKLWDLAALDSDVVNVEGKWLWCFRYWPDSASALAIRSGRAERITTRGSRVLANFPHDHAEWRSGDVSSDGQRVVLGDAGGWLEIWKADGSERHAQTRIREHSVFALDWSSDEQQIAAGCADGAVLVLDGSDGSLVRELPNAGAAAHAVAFEPHGHRVAVGGARGELTVYDADNASVLATSAARFAHSLALAWSPDSAQIALALDDGRIALLDARNGELLRELVGHTAAATGVAFAPDGSRVASCSRDRSVRLWETATGRECAVFVDHAYDVEAIAFAPDGGTFVTGSPDNTLRWWIAGDRAERTVESLRRKLFLARDVRAALARDAVLSDAERAHALELAEKVPDDPRDLALEAWAIAYQPANERAEFERAAAMARKVLEHEPNDALAHTALAAAMLRLGQLADALTEIDRAPVDERRDVVRALILARLERAKEAADQLAAAQSRATDVQTRFQVGLRELLDEAKVALAR